MINTYVSHLACPLCSSRYALESVTYTCPQCGPAGTLEMVYDFARMKAETGITPATISGRTKISDLNMWRYRPLLPVLEDQHIPPMGVGWTPLVYAPRLAKTLNLREVWVKDDGRNPTASLKDRASAMVVARAAQIDAPVVTTASSGNAAAALAGVCASAGRKAVIFVPASAPQAKITQLRVYGATVFLVQGSYDDAFDLSVKAAEEFGWYCRNTGMNPYTTEGKKTASLEIAEQLGWQAPDVLLVPTGDGNILAGQYKAFADLEALGWISRLPRIIGVQAEGSASLVHAWERNTPPEQMQIEPAETVADSISVGLPRDRVKAMRAVRATNGAFISVSDQAILDAIPDLARQTGVFAEPAGSTALAGLYAAKAKGLISASDRVVLLVCGNGLKDIKGAMRSLESEPGEPLANADKSIGSATPVAPSMDAVRRVVRDLGLM